MLGYAKLLKKPLDSSGEVRVWFALWRKSFVRRHGELRGRDSNIGKLRVRSGGGNVTEKGC